MSADIFYTSAPGRLLFQGLQKAGAFRLVSRFLQTGVSRCLIPGYIRKNRIDMRCFEGQTFGSFADFFARKQNGMRPFAAESNVLISPCDALLSVYDISPELTLSMKGSIYALEDLLPDRELSARFEGGLCLVFRLEAADYHHFCCFDDAQLMGVNYISGQLHSVQPIAHRHFPVFRLNRRWWSVLETEHFGTSVQIEVGAMMVGGVTFSGEYSRFRRGEEMGNFELAGSTVILLLGSAVRERLAFRESILPAVGGEEEIRIRMGAAIAELQCCPFSPHKEERQL